MREGDWEVENMSGQIRADLDIQKSWNKGFGMLPPPFKKIKRGKLGLELGLLLIPSHDIF